MLTYSLILLNIPEWKFRKAIAAVNQADEEKLSEVLTRMHEEDNLDN